MATIASIDTAVRANTSNFERGMRRARKQTTLFSGGISKLTSLAGRLGPALAGAFSVNAIFQSISQRSKELDALAKQADRLRVGTEALQTLGYVAELSGASVETMNKSLEKMTRTIGNAKLGDSAALRALEDIGIEVRDIEGLEADRMFGLIADKLNGIGDVSVRTAAATAIFGRGAADLMNTLAVGSVGVAKANEELERTNSLVGRDQLKAVEAANDAWTRFDRSIEGVTSKLSILTSKASEATANTLADIVTGDILKVDPKAKKIQTQFENPIGSTGNLFDFAQSFKTRNEAIQQAGLLGIAADAVAPSAEKFVSTFISAAKSTAGKLAADAPVIAALFGSDAYFDPAKGGRFGFWGRLGTNIVEGIERDMRKTAARIAEETVTPVERVIEKAKELERVKGFLTGKQYSRALADLEREFADAREVEKRIGQRKRSPIFTPPLFAPTAEFGSRSSFEARRRMTLDDSKAKADPEVVTTLKKMLDEAKKSGDSLRNIEQRETLDEAGL